MQSGNWAKSNSQISTWICKPEPGRFADWVTRTNQTWVWCRFAAPQRGSAGGNLIPVWVWWRSFEHALWWTSLYKSIGLSFPNTFEIGFRCFLTNSDHMIYVCPWAFHEWFMSNSWVDHEWVSGAWRESVHLLASWSLSMSGSLVTH